MQTGLLEKSFGVGARVVAGRSQVDTRADAARFGDKSGRLIQPLPPDRELKDGLWQTYFPRSCWFWSWWY